MSNYWVFCADVGSVKKGRFGWYGNDGNGRDRQGSDIKDLADAVGHLLATGTSVALGFECPLYLPIRAEPAELTSRRSFEGNRSWSAGAGCAALATGLVEAAWILKRIRAKASNAVATLDWRGFPTRGPEMLVWEAFISSKTKGVDDIDDARIAVNCFRAKQSQLPTLDDSSDPSIALISAALLWSGLSDDPALLTKRCLVIGQ